MLCHFKILELLAQWLGVEFNKTWIISHILAKILVRLHQHMGLGVGQKFKYLAWHVYWIFYVPKHSDISFYVSLLAYIWTITECLPECFLSALLCFGLISHNFFHHTKNDIWRASVYNRHNAWLAVSHIWKTNKVTHQFVQIDLFTSNNMPKWHFGLDYFLLKQCS